MAYINWFKNFDYKKIPPLPSIEEISMELPAVSEYLDAFRLPEAFKQAGSDTLPVIDIKGYIVGIISEFDLAQILPEWSFDSESYRYNITVGDIMTHDVWTETYKTNINDILAEVHQLHKRVIPIVDSEKRYTGYVVTRSELISFLTRMVKPMTLGGLATPLGVYITDGKHQAGAGNLGLMLTGVVFGLIMVLIQVFTGFIFAYIKADTLFVLMIQFILFIMFLKLTPLVKYHAAEHQAIHAIEKGLPLSIETVKMQQKAHKRCGTNLMILLLGIQFILIISFEVAKLGPFIQFLLIVSGFLFVFSYWQKVGMWVQKHFTTVNADEKHLKSAIKAGEEILKKHKADTTHYSPTFLEKIWNMGIIQIISCFSLVMWFFDKILNVL